MISAQEAALRELKLENLSLYELAVEVSVTSLYVVLWGVLIVFISFPYCEKKYGRLLVYCGIKVHGSILVYI